MRLAVLPVRQELKGNIRVFCRVRPATREEAAVLGAREAVQSGPEQKQLKITRLIPGETHAEVTQVRFA